MKANALAERNDAPASGDDAFRQLLRGLVLSERFHFYVAVCATPRVADRLLDELAPALPAERGAAVRFVRLDPYAKHENFDEPLSVDEMVASVLEPLVTPPDENRGHGVVHVLDASRASPDDEKSFRWLFGRLNELRNHVTQALGGELILLAIPSIEQLFVEAAPDFWSIRSDTQVFGEGALSAEPARAQGGAFPLPAVSSIITRPTPRPATPDVNTGRFEPFFDLVRERWTVRVPKEHKEQTREQITRLAETLDALGPSGLREELDARPGVADELAAEAHELERFALARLLYRAIIDQARLEVDAERRVWFSRTLARAFLWLTVLELEVGREDSARMVVAEAEGLNLRSGRTDPATWVWWLQSLGLYYRCAGEPVLALDKLDRSVETVHRDAFMKVNGRSYRPVWAAQALVSAAETALALGEVERAKDWCGPVLGLRRLQAGRQDQSPHAPSKLELRALLCLARAHLAGGGVDEALLRLDEAAHLIKEFSLARDSLASPLIMSTYTLLAEVHASCGDLKRAAHYYRKALGSGMGTDLTLS